MGKLQPPGQLTAVLGAEIRFYELPKKPSRADTVEVGDICISEAFFEVYGDHPAHKLIEDGILAHDAGEAVFKLTRQSELPLQEIFQRVTPLEQAPSGE
jgi:hypothetical protein